MSVKFGFDPHAPHCVVQWLYIGRMERSIPISSKVTSIVGARSWVCNLIAVWRQMLTEGGHAPPQESPSILASLVTAIITQVYSHGDKCLHTAVDMIVT